jgi:SagB-type dehydrogenase family enzyme
MSTLSLALETGAVPLPPPAAGAPSSVTAALRHRHSTRAFLPDPIELQELSDLLWAAYGVNRPQSRGRTAPSAHNWQEIAVHAVLPQGAYRYESGCHALEFVTAEDLRAATGTQDFVATAPLNLVYVADFARMDQAADEDRAFLAGADAGLIAENVYLHCAACGLGTVVRGLIDRRRLAHALHLQASQRIVLAQTVGHPAPEEAR